MPLRAEVTPSILALAMDLCSWQVGFVLYLPVSPRFGVTGRPVTSVLREIPPKAVDFQFVQLSSY